MGLRRNGRAGHGIHGHEIKRVEDLHNSWGEKGIAVLGLAAAAAAAAAAAFVLQRGVCNV